MAKRKVIDLPKNIAPLMQKIGLRVIEHRKPIHTNYHKFAKQNDFNAMTLWRIQKGEDYKMSSFLQLLKKLDVSPEDFFKGIK